MTNQTRDFDESDGRVLAEFCGMNFRHVPKAEGGYEGSFPQDTVVYMNFNGVKSAILEAHEPDSYKLTMYEPWSLEAPMWQIQSLKDAVREKGLEEEFFKGFRSVMYQRTGEDPLVASCSRFGELSYDYDSIMMLFEAPPEAICSAILNLEGEGE